MKTQLFSVYDSAAEAYLTPFFARSVGEAQRSFSDAVNDKDHQFNRHAGDYTLFLIGTFDDQNAELVPAVGAKVAAALELLRDDPIFPPNREVKGS